MYKIDNPSYTTDLSQTREEREAHERAYIRTLSNIQCCRHYERASAAAACLSSILSACLPNQVNVVTPLLDQPYALSTSLIGEGPTWIVANFRARV